MNRELLLNLNGNKTGQLKKFLDVFEGEPRIAWLCKYCYDDSSAIDIDISDTDEIPS